MIQAEYWYTLCAARLPAGASIVNDQWCRRTMSEAATVTDTTGFCGRSWKFIDGSRLFATDARVYFGTDVGLRGAA